MKTKQWGIIIGRFQVPELHSGHLNLFKKVNRNHKNIAIGLGEATTKGTKRDPLPYFIRRKIIEEAFPLAYIFKINDHPSDLIWSQQLDSEIKNFSEEEGAVLYGSRDSFLSHYKGICPTFELDPEIHISGSDVRKLIHAWPDWKKIKDFASGIIYSTQDQYPRVFQCVDIGCLRRSGEIMVLMGKKHPKEKWRFPGGFVDPADVSLEVAAKRELYEEVDVSIEGRLKYLGSFQIDDWRYRSGEDRIMTAFFVGEYTFGNIAQAKDDLQEVRWLSLFKTKKSQIETSHRLLFETLKNYTEGVRNEKYLVTN